MKDVTEESELLRNLIKLPGVDVVDSLVAPGTRSRSSPLIETWRNIVELKLLRICITSSYQCTARPARVRVLTVIRHPHNVQSR